MAIVDPTYLTRERNHFPSLTDSEFETLSIFCQTSSIRLVATYRGCNERQVRKHLTACKDKLCVRDEVGMLLTFITTYINKNIFPEELSEKQGTLLFLYALTGSQVLVSNITSRTREETQNQLLQIKERLNAKDIPTMRLAFLTRLILSSH